MFFALLTVLVLGGGLVINAQANLDFAMGLNELEQHRDERPPTFVTPGQTYRIATGSTVVLPCRISQPGSYVLAWKRGIAVLTAGPVKVTPDPRVRLLPTPSLVTAQLPVVPELTSPGGGYSLELRDVRPQDAGDYVCQIGTMEPKEITHTLEILVPPRIHYVSHLGPVEVLQGATVKMECRASGNPVPSVVWTRKNNVMPSGEKSVNGLALVLQHADRHSAGQYQCSADNGVGQPDSRHITVKVLFGPEVEPERGTVHTGIGLEAQLVCIVYAEPAPQVLWFKNTAQLATTEHYSAQVRGNRYTLTIRNVTKADFGNYSCNANNAHGRARSDILVTGVPGLAVFESSSFAHERHSYNVTWSVTSHAAVLEYRLFYRRHRPNRYESPRKDANATFALPKSSDWNSVVIPAPLGAGAPPFPGVSKHAMSYVIDGLREGATYECRVQAKNSHGWNRLSPIFHFTTKSTEMDNMVEPSAQPAVYGIGDGSQSNKHRYMFGNANWREISNVLIAIAVSIIKFSSS